MSGYFVLKASGTQYMFNLHAGNHEIILTSERYTSKASAQDGIASVQKNAPDDARYQRLTAKDGSPYFSLTATNGQSIGRSEMYKTTQARDNGIASVKSNAPGRPPRTRPRPEPPRPPMKTPPGLRRRGFSQGCACLAT
ncbi:hypothetical protein FR5810_01065 [Bordetella pertussis]|nr:hypothetical protein FR5810_01065 [Bordetella pertussis]